MGSAEQEVPTVLLDIIRPDHSVILLFGVEFGKLKGGVRKVRFCVALSEYTYK